MKRFDVNIDEFVIGKVVSLEELENSYKNIHSSEVYIKNFIGGRRLKYDNSKDAIIANMIGKSYSEKFGDDALLIFYQNNKDSSISLCFIDTASLEQNNSVIKLENLNIGKFASDVNKIEDMLLFFKSSPPRAVRYFVSGESDDVIEIIKRSGDEIDDKLLKEVSLKPVFSSSTKSKNILKITGVILLPLLVAIMTGRGLLSSSAERLNTETSRLLKEKSLLQAEIKELRANPFFVNEKQYSNISKKRIAI